MTDSVKDTTSEFGSNVPPTAAESAPSKALLRREVATARDSERHIGSVAILCSLAGIASGFALATTMLAARMAERSHVEMAPFAQRWVIESGAAHGFLGVRFSPTYIAGGAMVDYVQAGSPAAEIGLMHGDIIERYDGDSLANARELSMRIRADDAGHTATIDVIRNGVHIVLMPTLASNE